MIKFYNYVNLYLFGGFKTTVTKFLCVTLRSGSTKNRLLALELALEWELNMKIIR